MAIASSNLQVIEPKCLRMSTGGRVPGGTEVVQWQQGAGCGVDAAYNWIACGGVPVAVLSWACGRVGVWIQWWLGLWPLERKWHWMGTRSTTTMIAICSAFRRPSGSMAFRSHSDAAGEGERAPE